MTTDVLFYYQEWPYKFHSFSTSNLKALLEHLGYFGCTDGPPNRQQMLKVLAVLLPVSEQLAREYKGLEDYRAPPAGNNLTYIESTSYLVPEQLHLTQTSSNLGNSLEKLSVECKEDFQGIWNCTTQITNATQRKDFQTLEGLLVNISSRINAFQDNIQDNTDNVYTKSYQLVSSTQSTMNHLFQFVKRLRSEIYILLSTVGNRSAWIINTEYRISQLINSIDEALRAYTVNSQCDRLSPTEPPSNPLERCMKDIEFHVGSIHYRLRRALRDVPQFDDNHASIQNITKWIITIRNSIGAIRRFNIQTEFANYAYTHKRILDQIKGSLEHTRNDVTRLKQKQDEIVQTASVVLNPFNN